MKSITLLVLIFFVSIRPQDKTIISEDLELIPLTDNSYIHISYVTFEQYGRVPCNGLIYFNSNEAVIIDTPPNDDITKELIDWFESKYSEIKIKAVIVNHFHDDCLGGLNEFHKKNIPSYCYKTTPGLAKEINMPVPQNTFSDSLVINIGNEKVVSKYFGEAHTKDNITVYIPSEKILFGGCMVKSLGSGKGNLADANPDEWAATVERVKNEYKDAQFIIPGHGNFGGIDLLDYTINMFK